LKARLRKRANSLHLSFRLFKSAWQANSGAALVEAAVVLPVFLALVGGVYEFGFFLYQQQLAISGVRDAARYLALTADPNSLTSQAGARNLAVTGSIDGGTARIAGWEPTDVSIAVNAIDNSSGTYGGGSTTQIVTVSTEFADRTLGFLGLLGLKNPTISASHQERFVGGSAAGQGPS
jgi:Flp pilus assembly protein TadG